MTITTDHSAAATSAVLPINCAAFPHLVAPGQVVQVARYLATGSEGGSLYLRVLSVEGGEVKCVATNGASLDGLLTVMICGTCGGAAVEGAGEAALPLLTEHDVSAIRAFSQVRRGGTPTALLPLSCGSSSSRMGVRAWLP